LSGNDVTIDTSYTKTTIVLKSEMLYPLWLRDISRDLIKPAQPQNASKKKQEKNGHKKTSIASLQGIIFNEINIYQETTQILLD
jgi:hypothetical protein